MSTQTQEIIEAEMERLEDAIADLKKTVKCIQNNPDSTSQDRCVMESLNR